MKQHQKITLLFVIIFSFLIISFSSFPTNAAKYDYTLMEKIPGFESVGSDFKAYVLAIYQFGIWAVGIAAVLMLTIGGFFYMTSAGNTASAGTAKKIITDALLGLGMALLAYTILFIINPDLVSVNVSLEMVKSEQASSAKYYMGKPGETKYPTSDAKLPKACYNQSWKDAFKTAAGNDEKKGCILMAAAGKESSCTQKAPRTNNGRDCGAIQMNVADLCPGHSCEELENGGSSGLATALQCASTYLFSCGGKRGDEYSDQYVRDIYAGYNGGCGALENSNDCAGKNNEFGFPYKKWDCTINCNKACAIPGRTSTFLNYYKECINGGYLK